MLGGAVDTFGLAAELSRELGRETDVVDLATASVALLRAVLRDGVPVHEARPGAWGAFVAHTLCDLETDLPAHRRMQDALLRRIATHGLFGDR